MKSEKNITVTKHGDERVRKRIGVSKNASERQFKLALERGIRHGETKGKLNKWITSQALKTQRAKTCIVYNNHLFITDNAEVLITVIKVPQNLNKDLKVLTKKKAVVA